jgi:hypothetical protein
MIIPMKVERLLPPANKIESVSFGQRFRRPLWKGRIWMIESETHKIKLLTQFVGSDGSALPSAIQARMIPHPLAHAHVGIGGANVSDL